MTNTFDNKVKILSELAGLVPKSESIKNFVWQNQLGINLAFAIDYNYFTVITDVTKGEIESAWESLLGYVYGEQIWNDYGILEPEYADLVFVSLSDLPLR